MAKDQWKQNPALDSTSPESNYFLPFSPSQSHKDKTRPKERHKKSSDSLGSPGAGSIDKVGPAHRASPNTLIRLSSVID